MIEETFEVYEARDYERRFETPKLVQVTIRSNAKTWMDFVQDCFTGSESLYPHFWGQGGRTYGLVCQAAAKHFPESVLDIWEDFRARGFKACS